MEDVEEIFYIRYRGPAENREAIYNCLAGQSSNFDQLTSLLKDTEVGRATCMKDICDFVFKTPESLPTNTYDTQESMKIHKNYGEDSVETKVQPLEEVKTEFIEKEIKEECTSSLDTMEGSSFSFAPEMKLDEVNAWNPNMRPNAHQDTEYCKISTGKLVFPKRRPTIIQNQPLFVPGRPLRTQPYRRDKSMFRLTDRKRISKPKYNFIPLENTDVDRVSNLTLKRHNINFERRTN